MNYDEEKKGEIRRRVSFFWGGLIMPRDEECCPKFDPEPWNEVSHTWNEKCFLKETVPQFLHMPLPWVYGKTITRMWKTANREGIATEMKDFLLLAYDPSPWKSELYMSVTREQPGVTTVKLSGNYISKVFDGPYEAVPRYIGEMEIYLERIGKKAKKYYFYYTTCPKCAKKYGHNYIVALAEV